jgi:hypothetical protein
MNACIFQMADSTSVAEADVAKYSMTKLCLAADYYSNISPGVSKFQV